MLIPLPFFPNTYNIKNSLEIAQDINKLRPNKHMKLFTLFIKDFYTNLPTTGVKNVTKFCLHSKSHNIEENKQIITLLRTLMEQNYFKNNDNFYKPH